MNSLFSTTISMGKSIMINQNYTLQQISVNLSKNIKLLAYVYVDILEFLLISLNFV